MSYVIGFMDIALKELEKHPHASVRRLVVEVGEMTGVLPEYLHKYFPLAAKDTPLKDAVLEVVSIPVEAECAACANRYHPGKANHYRCPNCGEKNARLLHGRECGVKRLVIEEPDG